MRFRKLPEQVRAEYLELRKSARFKRWYKRQLGRQWHMCFYCYRWLQRSYTHTDHCWPVFHGGDNNFWNLVLACKDCNLGKSAKLLSKPYALWVRVRFVPLALIYELFALIWLFIQALYTTPKR